LIPAKLLCLTVILSALFNYNLQGQNKTDTYTDFDRGYYLYYYFPDKYDSAYLFFNQYTNNADDSLKKGRAFLYMGEILTGIGDHYGAQENLLNCIRTLNPKDSIHREVIGYAYNNLGNVSLNLKQYKEALEMYDQAIAFLPATHFFIPEIMNGKATTLQKSGNYAAAIKLYDSVLLKSSADQMLIARITDNRARTKWLQDQNYNALPELWKAMKIRSDSQYNMGLNASYAHLSEYYTKSNKDSALWYAMKMLEKARANKSAEDMLEAMDKIILLHSNPSTKQAYYQAYKNLSDSLQLSRDTTRNRFALIRYDVQKSRADNFQLQKHISRQQVWMIAGAAGAAIIILMLSVWYRRRKQRIKQESENEIRNARLKTSQKIHDVVANGLYGIMNELEHSKTLNREPLINKIEGLYEQSRNISYEDLSLDTSDLQTHKSSSPVSSDYDEQIHRLITGFADETTRVILVGNQPEFWSRISPQQKHELHLVLREMMVNMKKHSGATNVSIVFKTEDNLALISYKDDGKGITPGKGFGNGLTNTVNRIKSLGGAIIFGQRGEKGLSADISLPLESSTK